jgi:hypothetical protein
MIHTGDISHLSKPTEFDDADQEIAQAGLDVRSSIGNAMAAVREAPAGIPST